MHPPIPDDHPSLARVITGVIVHGPDGATTEREPTLDDVLHLQRMIDSLDGR